MQGEHSMAKKPTTRTLRNTWSEIAKDEAAVIGAATKAVERVPAPAEMADRALVFVAHTLKSQREALVPLLKGVTPKRRLNGVRLPATAAAVSRAYLLAENMVETQRKLIRGLVESVTPQPKRHAPKGRVATKASTVRRAASRKRVATRHAA
jgi:hypothetical protein